jgi:hypothetical protein
MSEKVSKSVWGVDSYQLHLGQLKSFRCEGGHRHESSEARLPAPDSGIQLPGEVSNWLVNRA